MKERCIGCFKNLSIKSRLLIYNYIGKQGKANVTDITSFISLKQPTVSYHLKAMNESGLLSKANSGREVYYSINHNCPHDNNSCVLHGVEKADLRAVIVNG